MKNQPSIILLLLSAAVAFCACLKDDNALTVAVSNDDRRSTRIFLAGHATPVSDSVFYDGKPSYRDITSLSIPAINTEDTHLPTINLHP